MRSRRCRGWAVIVTVILAACAPAVAPTDLKVSGTPTRPAPTPLATKPSPAPLTGNESALDQVVSDLANRLNVPPSEIKIVSQETATWPDGSLGCPKPGINYIQVPVDGLRIVLNQAGTTYEYHTGQSKIVLCEMAVSKPMLTVIPLEPAIVSTQEVNVTPNTKIEPGLQPLIDTATADLANRLSIDRNTVEVVSAQSVVWPDRSLGCPQPGMAYIQVLADGYRIDLRVKDQVYSYHGGEGRGPFLCENPSK